MNGIYCKLSIYVYVMYVCMFFHMFFLFMLLCMVYMYTYWFALIFMQKKIIYYSHYGLDLCSLGLLRYSIFRHFFRFLYFRVCSALITFFHGTSIPIPCSTNRSFPIFFSNSYFLLFSISSSLKSFFTI